MDGGGGGCTTMRMCLTPLNRHLKMVRMVNFMSWVFYHNKNNKKRSFIFMQERIKETKIAQNCDGCVGGALACTQWGRDSCFIISLSTLFDFNSAVHSTDL